MASSCSICIGPWGFWGGVCGANAGHGLCPALHQGSHRGGDLFHRRDLFSGLDLVFFDTTSLYFEGTGGDSIGQRGISKDHRPDLKQMVLGVIIDDKGQPICCEMWPGNTADVKSLLPVVESIRKRFWIRSFCIVADRGMISAETLSQLESP
jgi:transposase